MIERISTRSRPLVLVVDDELSARIIIRATLEESGFDVIEAGTVAEARTRFMGEQPDLIILDVILPDGNGIDLCAELRHHPLGRSLPIAMATGLDDTASIQQAFQSGATDFITKPIIWGTLGYRVRYLLRAHYAFDELARSEQKNRDLLSALPDLLFRVNREGTILECLAGADSPEWEEWNLRSGSRLHEYPSAVIAEMLMREVRHVLLQQAACSLEIALPRNVSGHWWEARILPCQSDEVLLVLREITRRKQLENQLRLSARVFECSNEAIMITDRRNHIISVNMMFEKITGYASSEVVGKEPLILGLGKENYSQYRNMWALLYENGTWQGELPDRRKNGTEYPAWLSMSLVRDGHGDPEYHIISFSDISERKNQEAQIEHLAYHDVLTGLPNRRLLTDRIEIAIAQAKRASSGLALLFIDLDRFKNINDSLGHHVGDQLLKEVAQRLRSRIRSSDTISRVGGDEFIVLCPDCGDPEDAAAFGEQLLQHLAEPYVLKETQLIITASIGIAYYPDNGLDANSLISNADAAMYQAKENDRNNCQFYSPEFNAKNFERLQLELRLRRALENNEFVLYFQPKLDANTGRLIGAETLIRWVDPMHGMIPPGRFIPLAEETGLIQPIGDWVLREVCRILHRWESIGEPLIPLAVNISARQFKQTNLIQTIGSILTEFDIKPAMLELELTEGMLMKDVQLTAAKLHQLKTMGFNLAVDDFGTGFSSLNYLRHFPLDVLKIDQSFVRELFDDAAALAIIDSIIALANALGMHTIAEGVETTEQADVLRSHGCNSLQGYLISHPLPEQEFLDWMKRYPEMQAKNKT